MLRALISTVSGSQRRFFDVLDRQASAAHDGATTFSALLATPERVAESLAALEPLENEAERIIRSMEDSLTGAWFTPIDREDIHRLSSTLDSLLARTLDVVRARDMVGAASTNAYLPKLGAILLACTAKINAALRELREARYGEVLSVVRDLRALRRDALAVLEEGVRGLTGEGQLSADDESASYRRSADPDEDARRLVRDLMMLEELDFAIDQTRAVADVLAFVAVKEG